jgi:5-methylcytosine-specific restriction protein A
MPSAPARPCRTCGKAGIWPAGYCATHARAYQQRVERARPTSSQRGYDKRWRPLRDLFLSRNPLCVICRRQDRLTAATHVDHIIPHRMNDDLRLDWNNLQALCASCHSRKTATEDGGFGHRRRA